jgi:hypothetical protein
MNDLSRIQMAGGMSSKPTKTVVSLDGTFRVLGSERPVRGYRAKGMGGSSDLVGSPRQ